MTGRHAIVGLLDDGFTLQSFGHPGIADVKVSSAALGSTGASGSRKGIFRAGESIRSLGGRLVIPVPVLLPKILEAHHFNV